MSRAVFHSVLRLGICAILLTINAMVPRIAAADEAVLYGCNINSQNGRGGVCDGTSCAEAPSMFCGNKWCTPAYDGCLLQGSCEEQCNLN
jgi:hypothetical protein